MKLEHYEMVIRWLHYLMDIFDIRCYPIGSSMRSPVGERQPTAAAGTSNGWLNYWLVILTAVGCDLGKVYQVLVTIVALRN